MEIKKFDALNVSSKFAICGLPIRVDTYKTCSFGCAYCFSNNRKIMEFEKTLQIGNIEKVRKQLDKILVKKDIRGDNFLEVLIANGITWHCGGMSDPFQPIEKKYKVTSDLIDLTNEYGVSVLFSTKSDTVYNANINPNLHTFQMSITNTKDKKDIEPGVPSIDSRYKFFKELKDKGFKVGVRIQPFIPGVTDLSIVEMFKDADNFSIEGIKIVPQNLEHKKYITETLGLKLEDFTQMGLLNLKPEIRLEMYKPFIEFLEGNNIPYSIADNDLHYMGTNKCCCGDRLVKKSTDFNNTALIKKYGYEWAREQVEEEIFNSGVRDCKCSHLFTSNRTGGGRSVQDFYNIRFDKKSSPFSPSFQYCNKNPLFTYCDIDAL